jgi:8-oxo-dGTP pyrophosphatase MutT (NUDIX family)
VAVPSPRFPGQPGFVVPSAADRPRITRRAVRVILTDTAARILLIRDTDLGLDPVVHWWITPGGGVDTGESDLDAAVRELREETGLHVAAADLDGPLLIREVVHGYSDKVVDQTEVFFHIRVPAFEVDTRGHTEQEQLTVAEIRWWTRDELRKTRDDVWPRDLDQVWSLVDRPELWRGGPVMGEPVDESTLAADDSGSALGAESGRHDAAAAACGVYEAAGIHLTGQLAPESEGGGAGACRGHLGNRAVAFRIARTTPKKLGQFVILWRRGEDGSTVPLDSGDGVDHVVVVVTGAAGRGHFIFSRDVLAKHGVMSVGGRGGKRAFRVYPPWSEPVAPGAIRAYRWQQPYFLTVTDEGLADPQSVRALFTPMARAAQSVSEPAFDAGGPAGDQSDLGR